MNALEAKHSVLIFYEKTGAINERVLTIRALAVGQLVQLLTP